MKSVSISVTEAARNFAECVNRARYQGTTFVLHKNRVPVARIEPAAEKPSTAGVLAEALAKAELSSEGVRRLASRPGCGSQHPGSAGRQMAIMLDADVLIANERGVFDLRSWLAQRPDQRIELAAITVTELLHGLERATGAHRVRRQAYIDAVLASCEVIPYTLETAQIHARLWAGLESSGKTIGWHDLIVAAAALEREDAVATFNVRHFAVVPGLTLITP